jgi:D-alanyl-lipoteichoic acid acyltransferase DltB (MBOAT superfamily)
VLFNSFPFFLLFLPLSLLAYFQQSKGSLRASIIVLMVASVAFYCYWDLRYLPLLAFSVTSNFVLGRHITRHAEQGRDRAARNWLIGAVGLDLAVLFFFKYFNFFLDNVAALTGVPNTMAPVALPIGISFFTFTQIAYLVDCRQGKVHACRPESYGLFVTYFPHLIAGPILHHKDMMPQFEQPAAHRFTQGRLAVGMLFFTIGLFKKVILADGVARYVAPVFDVHFAHLSTLEAWAGALAYTFQLYFDFSAYSDMAYGLSYMFGIILPVNFNSPYRAASIIDFWRRWHITLSAFLRDYLYVPLGGNRRGSAQRYVNLMITMLLGGLWHGASWTFLAWGGLHGLYLGLNHAWRHVLGGRQLPGLNVLGFGITFIAVVVGWVLFRAKSIDIAGQVLRAMYSGTLDPALANAALGSDRIMPMAWCGGWLAACALVAFCLPNPYQLLGRGLLAQREARLGARLGAAVLGAALALCLMLLTIGETRGVSEFLYFNF